MAAGPQRWSIHERASRNRPSLRHATCSLFHRSRSSGLLFNNSSKDAQSRRSKVVSLGLK